jgi:hypothetical protein
MSALDVSHRSLVELAPRRLTRVGSAPAAKIKQQIFGVATDSAHAVVGLMGAGPDLGGWKSPYPLVIDSLAQQGITNSRAFSMDLRGFDSARG